MAAGAGAGAARGAARKVEKHLHWERLSDLTKDPAVVPKLRESDSRVLQPPVG